MNIQNVLANSDRTFQESLFAVIDGEDWAALSDFFCDDCVYERPGYELIRGIDNLKHFYENERIIGSGKHTVEMMANKADVIFCEGVFEGVAKDGAQLAERFVDRYVLKGTKIGHRQTYFYRSAI
ncbi:MAG: nuclear transport factor 2 family protein [Sulfitobacter sp.]